MVANSGIFPITYRIPNLELDNFVVNLETIRAELDANGDLVFFLELVVHHSLHQATLSNACVTNDDQFEEVILSRNCFI